jgi:hypothetical protein
VGRPTRITCTPVGELVDGSRPGRTSSEQITFYKSVGVAAQDCAAAGRHLGLLVGERGWSADDYTDRTVRSLLAELLGRPPSGAATGG